MILTTKQFETIINNEGMDAAFIASVGEGSGWENQQDIKEWFCLGSPYQKSLHFFSTWSEMKNHLIDVAGDLDNADQMPKDFTMKEFVSNHLYEWSESAIYIQTVDGQEVFIEVAFDDFI